MNDTPFSRSTVVQVMPSATLEKGLWYARIDFYLAGKPVGKPRIFYDQPQHNPHHAMALARGIAEGLGGKSVS